jgi:hypothetical protein
MLCEENGLGVTFLLLEKWKNSIFLSYGPRIVERYDVKWKLFHRQRRTFIEVHAIIYY